MLTGSHTCSHLACRHFYVLCISAVTETTGQRKNLAPGVKKAYTHPSPFLDKEQF